MLPLLDIGEVAGGEKRFLGGGGCIPSTFYNFLLLDCQFLLFFLLFLDSVAGNTSTRYGAFLCHFGGTSHDDAKPKNPGLAVIDLK